MAIVPAMTVDVNGLQPGNHVLLKKRGETHYKHSMVVGQAGANEIWLLTPSRHIELVDFSSANLRAAKRWDGLRLPANVVLTGAVLASNSDLGAFADAEVEKAKERITTVAQPIVGVRIGLTEGRRRITFKAPRRGGDWVASESMGRIKMGDKMQLLPGSVVVEKLGVAKVEGDLLVPVAFVETGQLEQYKQERLAL